MIAMDVNDTDVNAVFFPYGSTVFSDSVPYKEES